MGFAQDIRSAFVSIIGISTVSGYIYFSFLQQNLLQREMVISTEFIQSVSLINNPEAYFDGSTSVEDKRAIEEFFDHVIGIPDVFRATVFDANYKIIWSNDDELVGKTFVDNDELELAYRGISIFNKGEAGEHEKLEHDFLPQDVDEFVESYIPVWGQDHQHVIGVVELYKSPAALFETLRRGRELVALVSLLGGLILFGLLYWVVRTAHQLIESQRSRIRQASRRGVELNEQSLRRIGSELHDGPVQSIGFALLKLDSIVDDRDESASASEPDTDLVAKIRDALNHALQEVRSLSSGLVIPELKDQSAKQAIVKVIDRHEKRTGTTVKRDLDRLPEALDNSTKICLYRLVQEGLNNAYRHGKGVDQYVGIEVHNSRLTLTLSDAGPGMDAKDSNKINDPEHLGIRGMRERVESLGGDFHITSNHRNIGVKLTAALPIYD
jgi:signal transduction histidine kinase